MKTISTLLIAFTFFANIATATDRTAEQIYTGYVILSAGDTLHGEIEFINPTLSEEVVIFYHKGKKTKYTPKDDLKGYAFLFSRHNKFTKQLEPYWFSYVVKTVPTEKGEKTVFLQKEVEGTITLYSFYTLETKGINERSYKHNYFVEIGGILARIDRINYRDAVKTYIVMGNTDLESNLGTAGFGYKYLSNLVNMQNAWLNGDVRYYSMLENAGVSTGFADVTAE